MKYLPDIYKKNIFDINYDKLKKKDIIKYLGTKKIVKMNIQESLVIEI